MWQTLNTQFKRCFHTKQMLWCIWQSYIFIHSYMVVRVILTLPGLRRLYCTKLDARTAALTQASAMWWHSSGTLRMSGCTRPQLHKQTETFDTFIYFLLLPSLLLALSLRLYWLMFTATNLSFSDSSSFLTVERENIYHFHGLILSGTAASLCGYSAMIAANLNLFLIPPDTTQRVFEKAQTGLSARLKYALKIFLWWKWRQAAKSLWSGFKK